MPEILLKNADTVLTMDDDRRELSAVDIRLRDGVIAEIGKDLETSGETSTECNTMQA